MFVLTMILGKKYFLRREKRSGGFDFKNEGEMLP